MSDDKRDEPATPRRRWDADDDQTPQPSVRAAGSFAIGWILLAVGGVCATVCCLPILGFAAFFFTERHEARVARPEIVKPVVIVEVDRKVEVKPPPPPEEPIVVPEPIPKVVDKPRPIDPPVPPPFKEQPLEVIKEPSVRFTLNTKSHEIKDIVFAPQAPLVGHFGKTSGVGPNRKFFELWNWQERKQVTRVNVVDEHGAFVDLSPRGTRLLAHQYNQKALNIWSLPEGNALKNEWRPYADQPDKGKGTFDRGDIAWAAFLDEEHALTIAISGRFDLWDSKFDKPKYTILKRRELPYMQVNGFSRGPTNLALSADRKTLALANGDGFEFFDAFTGKALGQTELGEPAKRVGNVWATAFSPDGASLVSTYHLSAPGEPAKDYLTIWNVANGQRRSHFLIETVGMTRGPIAWLGPKHLMIWDGNVFQGAIFNLEEGRFQRALEKGVNGDHFARQGPDNRIWYASSPAFKDNAQLLAVDFPEDQLRIDPAPPGLLHQLPRWSIGPLGISRKRPAN